MENAARFITTGLGKIKVPMGIFQRPKPEKKREAIYNELTVQFFGITRALDDEKKTELDGLLWDVALRLVEV